MPIRRWPRRWSLIEARLAQPLTVSGIAKEAGVSHSHLTRLFRAATGQTVMGYIRARRMAQARHLLRAGTLSISAVAATVGIPDLQEFNKACRREPGASPAPLAPGSPEGENRPVDGRRLIQAAQLIPPSPDREYDISFLKHEFFFEQIVDVRGPSY